MNKEITSTNQKHTVKVNKGSGVLIQPMSPDYSYVLTAKHCIQEDKDNPRSAIMKNNVVLSFYDEVIPVLEVIHHQTKDIAILIVEPRLDCELMANSEELSVRDQVRLCGFPSDRSSQEVKYSSFIFNYEETVGGRLILAPDTNGVVYSNIVGFSGGGLFTLGMQDKAILLCAIETKMEGNINKEYHGKVSAIPIREFKEIVEDPSKMYLGKVLEPLLPLHLSSFEHLLKFTFDVHRGWADDDGLNLLQGCLRETATEKIKVNLSPHEILMKFKMLLTVHNRPENELYSRGLWVSLLELLTISILIDKPETVDIAYVDAVLQSRRFIYLGVKGTWREYLTDILQSGLEDLNHDGIVVAKTLSKSHQACFTKEFLHKAWKLKNIGRPLSDPKKIVNANKSLSNINSIVDLAALHTECIEAKEITYENHTDITGFDEDMESKLLMLLAKEYGTYLTIKDVKDEE
ncbi:MAG: serine protease [Colwellia sp.]|jgi:Trypsin.